MPTRYTDENSSGNSNDDVIVTGNVTGMIRVSGDGDSEVIHAISYEQLKGQTHIFAEGGNDVLNLSFGV